MAEKHNFHFFAFLGPQTALDLLFLLYAKQTGKSAKITASKSSFDMPTAFAAGSFGRVATINRQIDSRDVAGGVTQQEDNGTSQISIVCHSAQHGVLAVAL